MEPFREIDKGGWTPLAIDMTPTPDRQLLATEAQTLLLSTRCPMILATTVRGYVGVVERGQECSVSLAAVSLGQKLGTDPLLHLPWGPADHAIVLMPVPQRPEFETSLPPAVSHWSIRDGLDLPRRDAIVNTTLCLPQEAEPPVNQLGLLARVIVRQPGDLSQVLDHTNALATELGAGEYWILHNAGAHRVVRN